MADDMLAMALMALGMGRLGLRCPGGSERSGAREEEKAFHSLPG